MGEIEEAVLSLAGSPLFLLAVWALATVDGVIPPVPSESVVIAAAVLTVASGRDQLALLVLAAAAGAFCGDLIAFTIGRHLPLRRWWLFRSAKSQAVLGWAERMLASRGASFILAARFVPVGRVAVNMTAGATAFPVRRFVLTAACAGVLWAAYTTSLGLVAGATLGRRPLLAVLVGMTLGVAIGALVDVVFRRFVARASAAGTVPPGDQLPS